MSQCGWYQGSFRCRRRAVRRLPNGALTCGRHEKRRRRANPNLWKYDDLVRALQAHGCVPVRQTKTGVMWRTPGGQVVSIATPSRRGDTVRQSYIALIKRTLGAEGIEFGSEETAENPCHGRNPCHGFRPTSAPIHRGMNPVAWSSRGTTAAHILVGFNVGGVPTWTVDDVVDSVEYIRLEQGMDPGSSFTAQRGLYRQGPGQIVEEEGVKIDILNLEEGVSEQHFAQGILRLAERLAELLAQKEVIVEITRRGVTRHVYGVTPRPQEQRVHHGHQFAHNPWVSVVKPQGSTMLALRGEGHQVIHGSMAPVHLTTQKSGLVAQVWRGKSGIGPRIRGKQLRVWEREASNPGIGYLALVGVGNPEDERYNPTTQTKPMDRHFVGAVTIESAYEYAKSHGQLAQFEKAWKDYKTFHGSDPTEVLLYRIPNGTKSKVIDFGAALGRVPETRYHDVPEGSNKTGAYWIHKHPRAAEPLEVLLARTGLTTKVGGSYRVTKWWYD